MEEKFKELKNSLEKTREEMEEGFYVDQQYTDRQSERIEKIENALRTAPISFRGYIEDEDSDAGKGCSLPQDRAHLEPKGGPEPNSDKFSQGTVKTPRKSEPKTIKVGITSSIGDIIKAMDDPTVKLKGVIEPKTESEIKCPECGGFVMWIVMEEKCLCMDCDHKFEHPKRSSKPKTELFDWNKIINKENYKVMQTLGIAPKSEPKTNILSKELEEAPGITEEVGPFTQKYLASYQKEVREQREEIEHLKHQRQAMKVITEDLEAEKGKYEKIIKETLQHCENELKWWISEGKGGKQPVITLEKIIEKLKEHK